MADIGKIISGMPGSRSGALTIEFSGIAELTRALSRNGEVWKRIQQAAVDGMIENSEHLLGKAMEEAPIDEGTLRASGTATVYANGRAVSRQGIRSFVEETGKTIAKSKLHETAMADTEIGQETLDPRTLIEGGAGDAIVGEVGFNTPYALAQHERLDFHHPQGGKAKYLEDPLKENSGRYQENLERHLRETL
jgi:hypothetical protein